MLKYQILALSVFLMSICVGLNSFEELTFHMLEAWPNQDGEVVEGISRLSQQRVRIRGFLFASSSGEWVLSAEPNLKSCCVGSKEKANRQIVIRGGIEGAGEYGHVVQLEGRFIVDPIKDADGRWKKIYALEEVSMVQEVRTFSGIWILFAMGMLCVVITVVTSIKVKMLR